MAAALILFVAAEAFGGPYAAAWRREHVIGENANEFFVLRTQWAQPGSYYSFTEGLVLERIRTTDFVVLDTWTLKTTNATQDANTNVWSYAQGDSLPSNFAEVLYGLDLRPVFAVDTTPWDEVFEIDSSGVWITRGPHRARVLSSEEVLAQIPDLASEPALVGGPVGGHHWAQTERCYLTVRSGISAGDTPWLEDVLVVRAEDVLEAQGELDANVPGGSKQD